MELRTFKSPDSNVFDIGQDGTIFIVSRGDGQDGRPVLSKEEKIKWAGSSENRILTLRALRSMALPTGIEVEGLHLMEYPCLDHEKV